MVDAPARLLVVDDSIVVRRVLAITLRQFPQFTGAEIDEAPNGVVALRLMEGNRYALVLSDIRMPAMDGLEFVRRVRGSLRDTTTPIVLISTLGTDEDVRRGLEAGATAYIRKPIVPHQIKTALLEVLGREPRSPGPT